MASFFISYRVESGRAYAGRLYDRLAAHFGPDAIFFDKGSLRGGDDWLERINGELERAAAVFAVIDPQWPQSFAGRNAEEDFVVKELRAAIEKEKTIISLLVGGLQTMPERGTIPSPLHPMLSRQWVVLHETSVDDYTSSVARLIATVGGLDGVVHAVEQQAVALLARKQYAEAERVLLRQPEGAHGRAKCSAYLALARLAGRSFNTLHPKERETIEALLRGAHAAEPAWQLPPILLAILEIDYYDSHGLVSAEPIRPSAVRAADLDAPSRALLAGIRISRRALQQLQLDSSSEGTA